MSNKSLNKISRSLMITTITLCCLLSTGLKANDADSTCFLCLTEKSQSRCSNFVLLETSYKRAVISSGRNQNKGNWLLSADLGFMNNINPRTAVGASLYIAADDDGSHVGIRGRYRRWFGRSGAMDLTAGVIFPSGDNYSQQNGLGALLSSSIAFAGLISIDAQLEIIGRTVRTYNFNAQEYNATKQTDATLYLGASGHGVVAGISAVAMSVLVAAAYSAYGS